jgi:hypothetical protein
LFESLFINENLGGDVRFVLPGFIVPWSPPPVHFAVPLESLQAMKDELFEVLTGILRGYLHPTMELLRSNNFTAHLVSHQLGDDNTIPPLQDEEIQRTL